jgi:NADPH:quinone reductase
MRAIICRSFGPPESLVLEEVDDPSPGEGEVIVEIEACAITFPVMLMIEDKYQVKANLPFCPGGDVGGVISAVGLGVTDLHVGERVLAGTGVGGLADRVVVRREQVIPVPDHVDLVAASGFLYAYGTSLHGLKDRARIEPGESLLVLGAAGSVGLAAVELGAQMGARVIAAASTDERLALCKERGATETVNYGREDLKTRVRELTDGAGADVVYDVVGARFSEPALRSTAWGGRFLVVGFAAGDIPRIPLNLVLLKGCAVVGVWWGEYAKREPLRYRQDVAELVAMLGDGRIRPHVWATYPLEQAGAAMREVADRRAIGKVVVVPRVGV